MAGGKPILTCIDGEGSTVIENAGCGLTAHSGDSKALYGNILKLYNMSAEERQTLGDNARKYHFAHHSRDMVLSQLIDFIFS